MKRHNWVALVSYKVGESTARALMSNGAARIDLDHENRQKITLGCWDCELDFNDAKDIDCVPADDVKEGRRR